MVSQQYYSLTERLSVPSVFLGDDDRNLSACRYFIADRSSELAVYNINIRTADTFFTTLEALLEQFSGFGSRSRSPHDHDILEDIHQARPDPKLHLQK